MKFKSISISVITGSALIGPHAYSETSTTLATNSNNGALTIGAMRVHSSSSYVGGKTEQAWLPLVEGYWDDLFVSGDRVGSFIAGGHNWALALVASLNQIGDKNRGHSTRLRELPDLKDVITGGINIFFEKGNHMFSLGIAHDISSAHNGDTADISYRYSISSGAWTIYPEIGATWMSHQVSDYFYGVSQQDMGAMWPNYAPGSGFQTRVGISAEFMFAKHHSLIFDATLNRLSDNIDDSPIINNAITNEITLAYTYTF